MLLFSAFVYLSVLVALHGTTAAFWQFVTIFCYVDADPPVKCRAAPFFRREAILRRHRLADLKDRV